MLLTVGGILIVLLEAWRSISYGAAIDGYGQFPPWMRVTGVALALLVALRSRGATRAGYAALSVAAAATLNGRYLGFGLWGHMVAIGAGFAMALAGLRERSGNQR